MLIAESTKYGAGIKIFGDYLDLEDFYESIHYLVEGYPIGGGEKPLGEFVLGLAYDVRHANQGDREKREIASVEPDSCTYNGFMSLWPYILPQVALLRHSASYHPTTRRHQSLLFRVESCIEDVLSSVDPTIAREVIDWIGTFPGFSGDYHTQYLEELVLSFVTVKTKKARISFLPRILYMMLPWSKEYRTFAAQLEAEAEKQKCQPHELESLVEWPNFKE